jgi:hypothetical protein
MRKTNTGITRSSLHDGAARFEPTSRVTDVSISISRFERVILEYVPTRFLGILDDI